MLTKPFPRSYWVEPSRFLAGFYPGDTEAQVCTERMDALLDCGIRRVISLMEADEVDPRGYLFTDYEHCLTELAEARGLHVSRARFAIRDMGVPTTSRMAAILDAIDSAVAAELPVYVHCWGGFGRTGTVVGCYLARHGVATGQAALDELARLRTGLSGESPQTSDQCDMVRQWTPGR